MNINEKIVPILANKNGKPGIAFKNTETGEVSGWTAKGDINPDQQTKLDAYNTKQGKQGYRLDPRQFKIDLQRQKGKLADIRGSETPGSDVPAAAQPTQTGGDKPGDATTGGEVRQPPKPAPKPTLDPKLKADLDKFAPKINQDWAAANERLARVELARAQQRAAGKSVFDKEFRKTKVNPIMYKQPSVEKEAYEVVLDYLLSEGHAETVEEAHYVMMQLDSEYVQSIVEDSAPIPNIPSPVTKPKDTKKPPTDGDKDRPLVPPGGFGDLSKPRDRTPRGGIDMGRGTPPNHDPNKYKKGKPTPGRGEVAPNLPTF